MPFIEYEQKKILFIHIPKTGGTSVENWLESLAPLRFHAAGTLASMRCTPQHLRMSDFSALFGPEFFDYAFAISRNPYTRLESEYRMKMIQREGGFFQRRPSFSQWLERNLDKAAQDPWHQDNHFRPQWEFAGSGVKVFQLEQGLDSILQEVATQLNLPAPQFVEHALPTQKLAETIEWDDVDRMRVQERYSRDFMRFGYVL